MPSRVSNPTAASAGSSSFARTCTTTARRRSSARAGNFDGEDIIDIIVRQPATAQFIARRLYLFFVADQPDPEAIDELAEVFHASQYDIRAMLRALFLSDSFRSQRAYYAMVKSPAEHVVGLMRLVGDYAFPKPGFGDIAHECRYMGQDLLNPPSVEGWHTGKEWIDTGILVERVNFAAEQLGDVSQPGVRRSSNACGRTANWPPPNSSTTVSTCSVR